MPLCLRWTRCGRLVQVSPLGSGSEIFHWIWGVYDEAYHRRSARPSAFDGTSFPSRCSPEFSVYWPWGQALPVFPEVEELDVVDVSQSPGDIKIFMATLQGIVNRSQPRIYLIEGTMNEGKYTWLEDLGVHLCFLR